MRRGTKLGKYRLERRIGTGSFAEVWKARDTVEQRDVALKVAISEFVKRLGRDTVEREARIAARLSHPNIVAVRNADWIDDHFVIATDLAERNLAQYMGAKRSVAVGLRVILDVAAGLAYAHHHRVMHRDLKPENILIFSDRRAAIGDFGVAKFAETRGFTEAGTLGYMAPEQAYGRPRLASDVFSLGLIAYETLTGALPTWPFEWPFERHPRLERRVPEPIHRVLRKAIQVSVARRYRDAAEFHRALQRALDGVTLDGRKRAPTRRRARTSRAPSTTPFELETKLFGRRFGRALGLHYECYRCGGPISEPMSHCPWCGTRDNSLREVTRYPLVCPHCERGVRAEWTSCPWCYQGRFEGNGRRPPPDPLAERHCSRRGCEGQLRPFMRYCPLCKTPTRRPWSHPALPERCPRCRGPVSEQFWRHCPWCGRREPHARRAPVRRT